MRLAQLLVTVYFVSLWNVNGFFPHSIKVHRSHPCGMGETLSSSSELQRQNCCFAKSQRKQRRRQKHTLYDSSSEHDDDDDDEYIDTDSLGDWRNFRRSLAMATNDNDDGSSSKKAIDDSSTSAATASTEREVTENEIVLENQNKELAEEYASGIWAHQTPTPEVGGLIIRMPLEVELYRNYRHSMTGSKLRAILVDDGEGEGIPTDELVMSHWYGRSRALIEEQMKEIADMTDEEGQIDATTLAEDYSELLNLYLENQEQWQEVCLVLEQMTSKEGSKSAKTLVLNRPMAFKLTKDLGRLVYFGSFDRKTTIDREKVKELTRFMIAFREECGVYVGGPDDQRSPAILVHGIRDLPGAIEISPGSNIYRGGLEAAITGVLEGRYDPLEFRFFVGCYNYEESFLDVEVRLGKYQPIACARALALKQCISLPKPLWHEVMELSDGDLPDISRLEMLKSDEVTFEVLDESDSEILVDDDDVDIEIIDDDDDDDNLR